MRFTCYPSSKYPDEWQLFRGWLENYMLRGTERHIVRFVISENLKSKANKDKEPMINTEEQKCPA